MSQRVASQFGTPVDSPSQANHRKQVWIAVAILAIVPFALYFPTLGMYFAADDFGYVQLYSRPSLQAFFRLLATDQSQGIWGYPTQEFRPLVGLSYMLDYWFFGANPFGYHLTALLLHAISTLAIFGIAFKAAPVGMPGALFAALVFSLLPIHSESVAWVTGSKAEALPSALYLVAFFGFVWFRSTRQYRFLAIASLGFLGSLMSKELAITFPAMAVSYDVFRWIASPAASQADADSSRKPWKAILLPYLPIGALTCGYLALRGAIFESVLREEQWVFRLPEALSGAAGFRAEFGQLWQAFAALQEFNYRQFLLDVPPLAAGIILALLLTWAVLLLAVSGRRRDTVVWAGYFGAMWYLIASLPLLVTYHSVRHLYLPVAGPCIAVACLTPPGAGHCEGRAWRGPEAPWRFS